MKRVFVFQDTKSQKFWSIDIQGNKCVINYGKLGTDGQTQEKVFASEEEATKEVEKLIKEKTKKGYNETAEESAKEMKVEAKKYALTSDEIWEDGKSEEDLLEKALKDPKLSQYKHITFGRCSEEYTDGVCSELVDGIIKNKDKFSHVESMFFCDIEPDDAELSWIYNEGNYSDLLDALPNLVHLKVRGSISNNIGKKGHPSLRSFENIATNTTSSFIEELATNDFSGLEKLIIWVGGSGYDYGFEGEVDEFKPLLSKSKFPEMKYLGFVNYDQYTNLLKFIADSDILAQLETIDLSYGTMDDEAAEVIIANADKFSNIKSFKFEYNFISKDMQNKLVATLSNAKFDFGKTQEDDDKEIMISE